MGQTDTGQGGGAGEQAKEQARQVGGQAAEMGQQAKQQAAEKGRQAVGTARERAREQVDQRSSQAGEQLSSFAGDARTVGDELRKQGKEQPAKLAEGAAERVERLGGYLRDSSSDRILRDVEDFGRRQPLAVAAGAFAVGLLASRFLKASSSDRYRSGPAGADDALARSYRSSARPSQGPDSEAPTDPIGSGTGTRPTGLPAHG